MATIVDVAREAGVSASTVSHVVNGTRRVLPATARLVQDAIAVVGYRPNVVARSLKTASTQSVGVAISVTSNPYFSDIVFAIEAQCARLGLLVLLSDTHDDPERELEVVQVLSQRRVDGIILAPSADPHSALSFLAATRMPCVLVDRLPDDRFDQVGIENAAAMRELVEHVLACGHRRVGFVTGHPGFATTLERLDGYRAALAAAGIAYDDGLVATGSATTQSASLAAEALLRTRHPPTAIVAGNNLATIGAMRAVRALGLQVPQDVSVVGFDDFEWADCFEPRLTLVAQPCEEIGRQAARLLVERIASDARPRRTVRLGTRLVLRDSCARVA